jgi:hypothetical protein
VAVVEGIQVAAGTSGAIRVAVAMAEEMAAGTEGNRTAKEWGRQVQPHSFACSAVRFDFACGHA